MSKVGIAQQVISYLEGRRSWLRSGGNNLPAYLSVALGNGPQVDALNELFRDPPPELFVEHEGIRVTRVGLTAWCEQADVESEDVPEDLSQAWATISLLLAKTAFLEGRVTSLEDELEEGLDLLIEQQVNGELVSAPEMPAAGVTPVEQPAHCSECAGHLARIGRLRSVIEQGRQARTQQNTQQKAEIKRLEQRNRELEPDARAFREISAWSVEMLHIARQHHLL